MSEHGRRKERRQQDQTRANAPRKQPAPGVQEGPWALHDAAGNRAVSSLLRAENLPSPTQPENTSPPAAGSDRPLSIGERDFFEARFGHDLGDVRLHTDSYAKTQADALGAQAFTRGNNIVLGSEAPDLHSPAGKALLAHELAHVIQQQQSVVQDNRISGPEDLSERQADSAARAAMRGVAAHVPSSGAVPSNQRKEGDKKPATQAEVAEALKEFFERSRQAQGEKEFRITPHVRRGIEVVFSQDPFGWLKIQSLLNRLDYPGDPGKFANDVAAGLSGPVDRQLLERLKKMPVKDEPRGRIGRLKELVERTKPGEGQKSDVPDPLASEKRFEEGVKRLEKATGEGQPQTPSGAGEKVKSFLLKPRSVDVLRAGRIIAGLPEAIKGPKPGRPTPAVSALSPEVEKAIQARVEPQALVPPDTKENASNFPDGQEVARALARLMDQAHQAGEKKIELNLGEHYRGVKAMLPVLEQLKHIAQVVKEALPHHAPGVTQLNVHYGDKVAPIRIEGSAQ